jgi:hypothetical protein
MRRQGVTFSFTACFAIAVSPSGSRMDNNKLRLRFAPVTQQSATSDAAQIPYYTPDSERAQNPTSRVRSVKSSGPQFVQIVSSDSRSLFTSVLERRGICSIRFGALTRQSAFVPVLKRGFTDALSLE